MAAGGHQLVRILGRQELKGTTRAVQRLVAPLHKLTNRADRRLRLAGYTSAMPLQPRVHHALVDLHRQALRWSEPKEFFCPLHNSRSSQLLDFYHAAVLRSVLITV